MDSYIYHHGIKGMKWGVRRYQNEDGSLTPAGKKRKIDKIDKIDKTDKTERMQKKLTDKTYRNIVEGVISGVLGSITVAVLMELDRRYYGY